MISGTRVAPQLWRGTAAAESSRERTGGRVPYPVEGGHEATRWQSGWAASRVAVDAACLVLQADSPRSAGGVSIHMCAVSLAGRRGSPAGVAAWRHHHSRQGRGPQQAERAALRRGGQGHGEGHLRRRRTHARGTRAHMRTALQSARAAVKWYAAAVGAANPARKVGPCCAHRYAPTRRQAPCQSSRTAPHRDPDQRRAQRQREVEGLARGADVGGRHGRRGRAVRPQHRQPSLARGHERACVATAT
jgi:hypothetical protein